MHRVQGEREIPVWFETHCLRIAETRRRQYFLIFLQIPNDFGFKLFVTALSGSQEMFLTLPPLVENPPAAAVNQDPCHTQIGKSKGSNDLWPCFDALGLCVERALLRETSSASLQATPHASLRDTSSSSSSSTSTSTSTSTSSTVDIFHHHYHHHHVDQHERSEGGYPIIMLSTKG